MPQTAVVIGSGMAGLVTAQVLSKHFDSVIVIEKDHPMDLLELTSLDAARMDSARPGVQQYNQLHAMSTKGLQLLEDEVFDGCYCKQLAAAGARMVNNFNNAIIHHPVIGFKPLVRHTPAEPDIGALCTRHVYETTARKLVCGNPGVQFVYGRSVSGLVFANAKSEPVTSEGCLSCKQVTGVRLSDDSSLKAQLVVDCSGRGSNLPAWLAAAGYKRPRTSRVTCNAGYTSWLCKLDPRVEEILDANGVTSVRNICAPPQVTGSMVLRVEGGMCSVCVGGAEGQYPGRGEDVLQFASERVWHPAAGSVLAGSIPLAPAVHFGNLTSTWRHYEEVALPDGLLVLGDAISSFNPVYGQGMSVAVMEAVALSDVLSARAAAAKATGTAAGSSAQWLAGLSSDFFKAACPIIKRAWDLAARTDMLFKGSASNEPFSRSVVERMAGAYVTELFKIASCDAVVKVALGRMLVMKDPPKAVLRPSILLRVLVYKALELTPLPLRGVLLAAAKPWGFSDVQAALSPAPGSKEAALAELMGWPTAK